MRRGGTLSSVENFEALKHYGDKIITFYLLMCVNALEFTIFNVQETVTCFVKQSKDILEE